MKKLSEAEWNRVFEMRCKSKRGEQLPEGAATLFERAYFEDPDRYIGMSRRVFEATKPVGAK